MVAPLFEFAFGLLLGFSLTIPPGPMNAFIAARTLRSLRQGITAGAGAMSADLVLGIVAYGLHATLELGSYLPWVYLVGAAVMVYLGLTILRPGAEPTPSVGSGGRTYVTALGLGVSNPFQIVWWLTAGLAFAYFGGLVLFVGLFGAIAVWIVVFPWALRTGARGRPGVVRAVPVVSSVVLFASAAYFLYLAVTSL